MSEKPPTKKTVFDDPQATWQQVEKSSNPYLKRALIIFGCSFVLAQIIFTVLAVSDGDLYNPGARIRTTVFALLPVMLYFSYLWIKNNWFYRQPK